MRRSIHCKEHQCSSASKNEAAQGSLFSPAHNDVFDDLRIASPKTCLSCLLARFPL